MCLYLQLWDRIISPCIWSGLLGSKLEASLINRRCCYSMTTLCFVVVQSRSHIWLCNPMDCSMPGFLVLHYLLEFAQTHVHWVGDTIQPSHPLSSPSPPAFKLFQHQGLFQWVQLFASGGQSIGASVSASVLLMNIQSWFLLGLTGLISLKSKGLSRAFSNTNWFKNINSLVLSLLYGPTLTAIHEKVEKP